MPASKLLHGHLAESWLHKINSIFAVFRAVSTSFSHLFPTDMLVGKGGFFDV